MDNMHIACVRRSGEIDIIPETLTISQGVIKFARGPRELLEEVIATRARHSYHAGLYLVPGVPEAETAEEALAALEAWVGWAFGEYPRASGMRVVS